MRWYLSALLAAAMTVGMPVQGQEGSMWGTECSSSSLTSPLVCRATHRLVTEGNQILFEVTILTRQAADSARLSISGPLGFYLPEGIHVRLDGSDWRTLEVERCVADGCFASIPLAMSELDAVARANEIVLAFSPQEGSEAAVNLPTRGLFDSVQLISE